MASGSVPTLPKAAPKKTLKRIMLARPDEEIIILGAAEAQAIVFSISKYVQQFESRNALNKHIVLGFNSISRKVELCDAGLVMVLLNASVKPKLMISTLFKLCVHKKVPVACLENFEDLCGALSPLFKGLKQNFVALGILSACPKEFQGRIIEKLPRIAVPEIAADVNQCGESTPDTPQVPHDVKRTRLCTPAAWTWEFRKAYLSHSEASACLESYGLAKAPCDTLEFAEGAIPFVDYDSFIGSNSPLIKAPHLMEVDERSTENSCYKPPLMKLR